MSVNRADSDEQVAQQLQQGDRDALTVLVEPSLEDSYMWLMQGQGDLTPADQKQVSFPSP